jgi:hypothetical protein
MTEAMKTLHAFVVAVAALAMPALAHAAGTATRLPTVKVFEGQNATVRVADRAKDGKSWKVVQASRTLGYPTKQFVNTRQGGQMRLTWNTRVPNALGTHSMKMAYGKPNAAPTKTAQVSIKVVPMPYFVRQGSR